MFRTQDSEAETVVSLLAAHVRRDISFGVLAPDTKLKIDELRGQYGGSAHSLREALTLLSFEGIVEATAQRGFRVASATQEDLEDVTRMRVEIEGLGLRWAMIKGGVHWEGAVIAAHHALARIEEALARDPFAHALEWDEANRAFHAALIETCGSPLLIEFHGRLYNQSRRYRLAALRENSVDLETSRQAHQDLVGAVVAGEKEQARDLLEKHIKGTLAD